MSSRPPKLIARQDEPLVLLGPRAGHVATLGLAKPRRFQWALRAVAGAILLGYLAYATHEAFAWWQGKPLGLLAPRAASNLVNALWGLAVFGLPSLYFLFRGRSGASVDVLLDIRNGQIIRRLKGEPSNKGMKQPSIERIGRSGEDGYERYHLA